MPRLPRSPTPVKKQVPSKTIAVAASALLQAALSAHQAGRLAEAETGYREVLLKDGHHANALHLLGVVHLQRGQLTEAEALIRKALGVKEDAVFLGNLGSLLMDGGRLPEAEVALRRALELKPGHVEAHSNLGILLKDSRRVPEAEAAFRQALALKPDYADAHNNLGILLKDSRRLPEAEAAFRQALALKPDCVEAFDNLGVLLKDSQRLPEAEAVLRRALEIKPGHAEAYNHLGCLLKDSRRPLEAEAALRRALELKPHYAEAYDNLGNLLKDTQRLPEAEAAFRRALELKPGFTEACNNLGIFLKDSRRVSEAEAVFRRALEFRPGDADIQFNLSLLLLALQRYQEAWPLYESRYAPEKQQVSVVLPDLAYPQWKGESLAGKSLVVWPEQGFGDYIQFARYLPFLKARGVSRLTVACSPPLAALLEMVEGVDAVVTDLAQVPAHDYWSFILSLPLRCATRADIAGEAPVPYLQALPSRVAQWREAMPSTASLKVGLVWRGSPKHKNDAHRSLPGLACLAPLWSAPGITFVSLQKGPGEEDALAPPAGQPLVALGTRMQDFADSAAIVSLLDLVICVDTAIAHVAGAMGKPCWVLLPAVNTDWRWLLEGKVSPWYPGVRLFRQPDPEGWNDTIHEVADALKAWAQSQS